MGGSTLSLHDYSDEHHADAHSTSADDRGDPASPCVHPVHVRPSEDVEYQAVDAVRKQTSLDFMNTRLLKHKYGIV